MLLWKGIVSNVGGLKSTAQVSNAPHQMAHKSAAAVAVTAQGITEKTAKASRLVHEQELAETLTIAVLQHGRKICKANVVHSPDLT